MAVDEGLVQWVKEALEPLGHVTGRRMMGGMTFYCDGTIFAIAAQGELWFKADGTSDAIWEAEGAERFTVEMNGKPASMNYRRAPAEVYDDPDEMRRWALLGLEAGHRAPPKKLRKRKGKPAQKQTPDA